MSVRFSVEPLPGQAGFGAVMIGLRHADIADRGTRRALLALFVDKGVIVLRGPDGGEDAHAGIQPLAHRGVQAADLRLHLLRAEELRADDPRGRRRQHHVRNRLPAPRACLFPDGLDCITDAIAGMTREERFKIFSGNAARVYNIAVS